jgi:hypothetical protein
VVVGVVGVGPGGTVTVGDEDAEVEWPWRGVEMRRTAEKSGPGKCGVDLEDSGSRPRDRAITVDLSLNAQSDRSPPYDSFPLLPI